MCYTFTLCDPITKETLKTEQDNPVINIDNDMCIGITTDFDDIISKVISEYPYCLDGKTGSETIPVLKDAILKLSEDNAKRALSILLDFAQMRPDGIWSIF